MESGDGIALLHVLSQDNMSFVMVRVSFNFEKELCHEVYSTLLFLCTNKCNSVILGLNSSCSLHIVSKVHAFILQIDLIDETDESLRSNLLWSHVPLFRSSAQ